MGGGSAVVPRPPALDAQTLKRIGWQVKRIIDEGRAWYMRTYYRYSIAEQVVYCDAQLSPENVLLVGRK